MAITFNHLNLLASAHSDAVKIFVDVLGLEIGSRPNFPFKGQWLYQGDQALVHIIESEEEQACRLGHIAFDINMSLPELTMKLQQQALKYNIFQVPDSSIVQVFVKLGDLVFELQTKHVNSQQAFDIFSHHQELL
ncbi:hypothetical protein Sps_02987 [Shewanella psychrophila]|uniref:VOC domain-containing protein n=1 Tax=Shewanella psychrophila TaxID=225848 RepID=A0A1S6HRM2_9GAMM|nr:hypothetical protein [Shewanella psychrophila]AQS38134.1 hypothetical protein Sps_02987 [Shewanella psychrophila]